MTSGEMTTTILHLIPSLEVGGSETLLLDLVRGTRDAPYQHVVVSMIGEGALVETFRDEGVPVHSLGMARAIYPAHTMGDGDAIFALATGGPQSSEYDVSRVGALGAEVMAEAILRAVRQATGIAGFPSARDLQR